MSMTKEEIDRIPLKFSEHLAMAEEHISTYVADGDYPFELRTFIHTPADGKPYCHYELNGKVYKSMSALYKAMEIY